jgi:hypothetical protein
MILESVRDRADVRAGGNFKTVCDSVIIEEIMQLGGIKSQPILIAHIHRDSAALLEITDVLIDKGAR